MKPSTKKWLNSFLIGASTALGDVGIQLANGTYKEASNSVLLGVGITLAARLIGIGVAALATTRMVEVETTSGEAVQVKSKIEEPKGEQNG